MTFEQLGIASPLIMGLKALHIDQPTRIQQDAIPLLIQGKDASVCAATGTGKTLAYLLPLLQGIDTGKKTVQAMILAPTHELAMQVVNQARELVRLAEMRVRVQALIGGVAVRRQVEGLKTKPHLLVGSVGRIRYLIEQKKISPHTIRTIVVDEVDCLLHGDHAEGVRQLITATSRQRTLVFVSATVRSASWHMMKTLAPDLAEVHVDANRVGETIIHQVIRCKEREKIQVLRRLMYALRPDRAIAFVHTNRAAAIMTSKLLHHKLLVADIHGMHDKLSRHKALDDLRRGRIHLLLASDMAARGLDIKDVTHIFNVDIPSNPKDYLHRVGRTGRAGAQGWAISLATDQEVRLMERFTRELGIAIAPIRLFKGRVVDAMTQDKMYIQS